MEVGVLVPAVVIDGDITEDTVTAGLPDTVGAPAGLLVGLCTRNTATLRLRMVALRTPASLASQE